MGAVQSSAAVGLTRSRIVAGIAAKCRVQTDAVQGRQVLCLQSVNELMGGVG